MSYLKLMTFMLKISHSEYSQIILVMKELLRGVNRWKL